MFVFLVHAILGLEFVQKGSIWWLKFISIMLIAIAALTLFGWWVWPPVRRHLLTEKETIEFEKPLIDQKTGREQIELMCPGTVEEDCTYAAQFINIFREAGWTVKG